MSNGIPIIQGSQRNTYIAQAFNNYLAGILQQAQQKQQQQKLQSDLAAILQYQQGGQKGQFPTLQTPQMQQAIGAGMTGQMFPTKLEQAQTKYYKGMGKKALMPEPEKNVELAFEYPSDVPGQPGRQSQLLIPESKYAQSVFEIERMGGRLLKDLPTEPSPTERLSEEKLKGLQGLTGEQRLEALYGIKPNQSITPEQKLGLTTTLRKEFDILSKDYRVVRDSYARLQASNKDPSAAGDLAIIFSYMKMLDPTSVVREGEFATAENTAGISDRIRNMYNRLLTGERLQPPQRQDFINTARGVFNAQQKTQKTLIQRYRDLSGKYTISPDEVITDISISEKSDEEVLKQFQDTE